MATTNLIETARRQGWKAQPGANFYAFAGTPAGGDPDDPGKQGVAVAQRSAPWADGPENTRQELHQKAERRDLPDPRSPSARSSRGHSVGSNRWASCVD